MSDIIDTIREWATTEPGLAAMLFCSLVYILFAFAASMRGKSGANLDPWTLFFSLSSAVFFILSIILAFSLEITVMPLLVAFVIIGIMFLLIQFELLRRFVLWVGRGIKRYFFGRRTT